MRPSSASAGLALLAGRKLREKRGDHSPRFGSLSCIPRSRAQAPQPDHLAFRARSALLEAAIRALRDDQLVDEGGRLYLEPGPGPGPFEISRQAVLQRAECRQAVGKPEREESERRMDVSERQEQSRRKNDTPLPIPGRTSRAPRSFTFPPCLPPQACIITSSARGCGRKWG